MIIVVVAVLSNCDRGVKIQKHNVVIESEDQVVGSVYCARHRYRIKKERRDPAEVK